MLVFCILFLLDGCCVSLVLLRGLDAKREALFRRYITSLCDVRATSFSYCSCFRLLAGGFLFLLGRD